MTEGTKEESAPDAQEKEPGWGKVFDEDEEFLGEGLEGSSTGDSIHVVGPQEKNDPEQYAYNPISAPPRPESESSTAPPLLDTAAQLRLKETVAKIDKSRTEIPKTGYSVGQILLALVVLLVIAGAAYLTLNKEPPPAPTGSIMITSTPDGAEIFIDGAPTPHKTPFELKNVAFDTPKRISVSAPGHESKPKFNIVTLSKSTDYKSATFTLRPTRIYRIETTPPKASVYVDDKLVPGFTPVSIPPLVDGDSVSIKVTRMGYMTKVFTLTASEQTEKTHRVALEPAKLIEIASAPAGALVFVNNERFGQTPVDITIPKGGKVQVRIEQVGYSRWTKTLNAARARSRYDVKLRPVPLMKMALSPDEKLEARRLTQLMKTSGAKVRALKSKLKKAEAIHKRVISNPESMFGQRIRAEEAVEKLQEQVTEMEDERTAAAEQLRTLRTQVMGRLAEDLEP